MDLLGSALIIHPHLVWAHIEEGHEKLEWVQFVDLIKVLETRVREDQLEKNEVVQSYEKVKGRSRGKI